MKYWKLDPEVPAELGDNTDLDTSTHPPIIKRLHLLFRGWLGDELIESFPVFAVTPRLGLEFSKAALTGFHLAKMEVEISEEMVEVQPDVVTLPDFEWLVVDGSAYKDDFGINKQLRLVVSDPALAILREGRRLAYCRIDLATRQDQEAG
jgi:hypothetical protein